MLISNKDLLEQWINNPAYKRAKQHLLSWKNEVEKENWKNPNELKAKYGNASILKNNIVVFNINGNNYRLIINLHYGFGVIFVKWFGTHKEYDKIDANKF